MDAIFQVEVKHCMYKQAYDRVLACSDKALWKFKLLNSLYPALKMSDLCLCSSSLQTSKNFTTSNIWTHAWSIKYGRKKKPITQFACKL